MNVHNSNSSSTNILTLDQLLDGLGFRKWEDILNKFLWPILNLSGVCTCSLSAWIFLKHQRKFGDPIFFYYRLLTLVYMFVSIINIPMSVCFSPRFFHAMDTYSCTIYNIIYTFIILFLFHYCSVLEICILVTRMKTFSPFVKKHFSASPKLISLFFFLVCLIIDSPFALISKVGSLGEFYAVDSNGMNQTDSFNYLVNSDFSLSPLGQLLTAISYTFNAVFTLIVGVTLSIVSILQYKAYLKKRKVEAERIQARITQSLSISTSTSSATTQNENQKILATKKKTQRKIEKSMLYMAFSLSTVSIISRLIITLGYVSFVLFYEFSNVLVIITLFNAVFALVPATSILIFYSFNEIFRQELRKIFRPTAQPARCLVI